MKLKIVTWNMDHWKRSRLLKEESWTYLESLEADVALVQEAVPLVEDETVF